MRRRLVPCVPLIAPQLSTIASSGLDRSAYLDASRLFAAGLVWAFHLEWLTYGYLGVPLFFAISGFVIAASRNGKPISTFLIARLARLWPAFFLCMTATAILSSATIGTYAINLTMVPRIFGVADIDPVYWSLMFEILFYGYVAVLGTSRSVAIAPWWLALCAIHIVPPSPARFC